MGHATYDPTAADVVTEGARGFLDVVAIILAPTIARASLNGTVLFLTTNTNYNAWHLALHVIQSTQNSSIMFILLIRSVQ
jgi:hypothetical protein